MGRPKGSPNKVGADVQAAMLAAANRFKGSRNGLVNFMEKIRDEHPEEFFKGLCKLLPKNLNLDANSETMVKLRMVFAGKTEIDEGKSDGEA